MTIQKSTVLTKLEALGYKIINQDTVQIHWTDVLYNPYRKGLFPGLLRSDNHEIKRVFYSRCKGMKKDEDDIKLEVIYDEDYLIKYLINKLFIPLQVGGQANDFNMLMKVLAKAYKQFKEQMKNEILD
ncbi:hypothetical protein [Sphaerospermopsis sp. LEGE 08334]|uniref:hypothetical protein n=1 Tax=Sphaerospermopsis sp. LEGE 08334 TaxID=1828651 RepID=UPI00187FE11B|nr:hypothetical protein [Sphaerospermopsis sp. LEGE 08334]MBE9059307.1 hypothetical protein [Sphaerospermopsis sp. LEGE 08334]